MVVSEYERTELHHANETREVEDFAVGIPAIKDTRKIKEFCSLVDFCPKSLFERFLGVPESGLFLNEVEMGEDADDFWKSMGLQYVEELEGFLCTTS